MSANVENISITFSLMGIDSRDFPEPNICGADYEQGYEYGIRPVIILQPNISLKYNETAKEWNFVE